MREERTNTLKDWFTDAAKGEEIIAVVMGGRDGYKHSAPVGVVMTWEEALPHLTTPFYSGYGGAGCPPVYAWTASLFMHVGEYDGSTHVCWFPRNPIDCDPGY